MPVSSQPFPNSRGASLRRAASGHIVGTPSAIGAIRVRPSPLSQFMTLGGSQPASAASDAEAEQLEFEEENARLVLEVARARRTVCRLERELAEAKCEENNALCNLYKLRAEEAGQRLESAEYDIDCVRNQMGNAGVASDGPRKPKRHRSSRSTTFASGTPEV